MVSAGQVGLPCEVLSLIEPWYDRPSGGLAKPGQCGEICAKCSLSDAAWPLTPGHADAVKRRTA
jgi:hypothetical protein